MAGVRSQRQGRQPSYVKASALSQRAILPSKTLVKELTILYLQDKSESRLNFLNQYLGIWMSTLKLPGIPSDPNVMPQSCQDKLESGWNASTCWKVEPDVCVRKAMVWPLSSQQLLEPVDKNKGQSTVFE